MPVARGRADRTSWSCPAVPADRPSPVRCASPGAGQPAAPVRITRRGRLALLALVLAIVAVVGLMGMRGAGAVEPLPTVTVAPGQTLSEVALAELPQMSISEGILAIQIANQMSTAQVSAGQEHVIPRS